MGYTNQYIKLKRKFMLENGYGKLLTDRLKFSKSALIVIDVQNDFCHNQGAFSKMNVDVSHLQKIIPNLILFIEKCRQVRTGLCVSTNHCWALKVTKGQVKGEDFVKVMRSFKIEAPRGMLKFDKFGGPIHNIYIRKVEKIGDEWHNVPFATYSEVSQFWTWSPEEYMKTPRYVEMKGKWIK